MHRCNHLGYHYPRTLTRICRVFSLAAIETDYLWQSERDKYGSLVRQGRQEQNSVVTVYLTFGDTVIHSICMRTGHNLPAWYDNSA